MTRAQRPVGAICAVLFAIAVAGCGSSSPTPTPTPTPLSDPNEIVSRSITELATASTVHLDGTLNGSVDAGTIGALVGVGALGLLGRVKLDNASLSGDLDIPSEAAHISATFPTLFGLSAEVILVDGYSYTRFGSSNTKYTKSKVSTSLLTPSGGPDATLNASDKLDRPKSLVRAAGLAGTLDWIESLVRSAGVTAALAGHDSVDGRDSYRLTVTVPAELLNQGIGAAGGAAASGIAVDLAPIDYWVYGDTLQPAKIHVKVSSTTLGNIELTVSLTKYGQPVAIVAPPDNQVGT